jgi:ribonuclease HII
MLRPYFEGLVDEAGCDEAGRGCLAGPVVAAAVILPVNITIDGINDSKKLSAARREALSATIRESALAWAIGIADPSEIDQINILNASILAMHRALDQLSVTPGLILVDGNRFHRYRDIPHRCLVKGDATYQSIAAASILAKTCRDEIMTRLHDEFPHYDWNRNKGYPTAIHRKAILASGRSLHHRMSFRINEQLNLFRKP